MAITRLGLAVLLALILAFSAVFPASAGSNSWTRLGLAGKNTFAVAVAPTNPNLILAIDERGVVHRSTDRGKTWSAAFTIATREGPVMIGHLEFDPQNAEIAYAVQSDWNSVIDPQNPSTLYTGTWVMIYRSTDGGKSWKSIGGNTGEGILRSTDRGQTWKETGLKVDTEKADKESYTTPFVFGVAVKPTDSRVLVADGSGKRDLLAIERSTDGGTTWQRASLPSGPALPMRPGLIYNSDGSALFTGYTVHRSLDDGQTWQSVLAKQGVSFRVFANPTSPSEVFATGAKETGVAMPSLEGIYRSTDKGASFSSFPAPPNVKSVPSVAFDRATPQTLYAATNDGVWAYTFGEAPVSAPDTLPKSGSPEAAILPILAVLAAALSLVGLRLRRRSSTISDRAR